MALFACLECGRQVSTKAETCPQCGYPLESVLDPVLEAPAGADPASVTLTGTSPSEQRTPREMDLTLEVDEVRIHIHQPGGSQAKMWVTRSALQEALDRWDRAGPIVVAARSARKEGQVEIVVD